MKDQPTLMIQKLNGMCTIQDLGRAHAQHLGFSASGAADEYGFLYANKLLNNDLNAAALELTFAHINITIQSPTIIAITGADSDVMINDTSIKLWRPYPLQKGDVLSLKQKNIGLHTYIAFAGGIKSQLWLDSRSQTQNEITLGFGESKLSSGSAFKLGKMASKHKPCSTVSSEQVTRFYQHNQLTLRFIPSRLWDSLSTKQQAQFLAQNYKISSSSNRMGYRLEGQKLDIAERANNVFSKPVNFGTIQLPQDGQPIVLMKERQTIGGYPTLGVVMQTDLFRLSQMRPSARVKFTPVSVEFAQQQLSGFYQKFASEK